MRKGSLKMSTKEIFIDPVKWKEEIDKFKSTSEAIGDVSTDNLKKLGEKSILKSMTTLVEITSDFVDCVEKYKNLSDQDVLEADKLKEKWVSADKQVATEMGG